MGLFATWASVASVALSMSATSGGVGAKAGGSGVEVGGETVWAARAQLEMYYRWVDGPTAATPLVLLHPWGLDHRVWALVADRLAADRPVLLVDLPAHGRSDRSHTAWSMARLAQAVLDVLDAAGVARAIVAGNSLGGATALELARRAPGRVASMVLIAAPGGRRIAPQLRRLARQLATAENLRTLSDEAWAIGLWVAGRGCSGPIRATTRALVAARLDGPSWRAFSESASAVLLEVADYAPPLAEIRTPTLVIHGERDPIITEELSRALARGLPAAELRVLEDCGHMPELECPDALLAAMRAFVARAGAKAMRGGAVPARGSLSTPRSR